MRSEIFQQPFAYSSSNEKSKSTKQVLLGQSDLNDKTWSANRQEVNIKNVTIHEKYDGSSAYFDIAIIFTEEAIAFNDAVRPICLPNQPFEHNEFLKKHCGLAGWGQKPELDKDNVKLSFRHLQIYGQDTCDKKYDIQGESKIAQDRKKMLPNLFTDQIICAGSKVRFYKIQQYFLPYNHGFSRGNLNINYL